MNEDKLHRDIVRAGKAHALLENEMLQEAFAKLDATYVEAWRTWEARDPGGREALWQAVNVLGKVKEHLRRVMADGRLAQAQVEEMARTEAAKRKAR